MDAVLIVMAGIAALAAIVAAVGAWRPRAGGGEAVLGEKLADLERRLVEQMNAQRESFESRQREALAEQVRVRVELKEQATATGGQIQERLAEAMALLRESMATSADTTRREMLERLDKMREKNEESAAAMRRELVESLSLLAAAQEAGREKQATALKELQTDVGAKLEAMRARNEESYRQVQEALAKSLEAIRIQTEEKLERIRLTVDEKLQGTLEKRLGESFKLVSERLEQVHKGLGEMQTLATGVGDLKRVLTNVRSRGTFGEVQLGALLEQVLTPSQFRRNLPTRPGSNDRVEFAIVLPGAGDDQKPVLLPIDAKFPQEDFLRLQTAYEAGDTAAMEAARRGLETRLLSEARTIREKYLAPPHTTDFALMFLPTEGLFAEALRLPGLVERLQREHHVALAGPTTLYAMLASLQMGFRTLAIEKRSSEVWRVLGAVKTEFGKFGEVLASVKKKLNEASNKIEDTERRTRVMNRQLSGVESLPEADAARLLADNGSGAEGEAGED